MFRKSKSGLFSNITIINIYAPNNGAATFIKQTLLKYKSLIDHHTIIMGDFNTPLSPLDRSSKQKLNKETIELNNTINNLDLTDIYRIYHPTSSKNKNKEIYSRCPKVTPRISCTNRKKKGKKRK
uniref:Endonuclease/exonuclease/phosphatase domain-containing protein n=1 Tax=Spermophilus dauricus TaxID=99837 RepID=A0A8C9USZ4_SPEDA